MVGGPGGGAGGHGIGPPLDGAAHGRRQLDDERRARNRQPSRFRWSRSRRPRMDEQRARELLQRERERIEAGLRHAQAVPGGELSDDDDEYGDLASDPSQAELDESRRDELTEQL